MNNTSIAKSLQDALWQIYRRPDRPAAWVNDGNLPWNDPEFSRRMLAEHLDEGHSAASRTQLERDAQIDWFWDKLQLATGHIDHARVLDVTCGPGLYATALAKRGCTVTGIDFGPAAIDYARNLATDQGVAARCHFREEDIRVVDLPAEEYDAALLIYGQLAVLPPDQARLVLEKIVRSLKPGARLCLELLDPEYVDKRESTWWFTDDAGLWGDAPFLNLGERFWDDETRCSTERYTILQLESGVQQVIHLSDQTYTSDEMSSLLKQVGFSQVDLYPHWDQLDLYDAQEWNIFIATK